MISSLPTKGVRKGVNLVLPDDHEPKKVLQKRDIQRKTGQTGVPVIKIGSKWIVGFDQPAIERELSRS